MKPYQQQLFFFFYLLLPDGNFVPTFEFNTPLRFIAI